MGGTSLFSLRTRALVLIFCLGFCSSSKLLILFSPSAEPVPTQAMTLVVESEIVRFHAIRK